MDPVACATLAAYRRQAQALRALHRTLLDEPVPPSLQAAAQRLADTSQRTSQWWRWGGMAAAFEPYNFMVMIIGLAFGVIAGALPGISFVNAMAMALPFTYMMSPIASMACSGEVLKNDAMSLASCEFCSANLTRLFPDSPALFPNVAKVDAASSACCWDWPIAAAAVADHAQHAPCGECHDTKLFAVQPPPDDLLCGICGGEWRRGHTCGGTR
jgi:hypothetical protein